MIGLLVILAVILALFYFSTRHGALSSKTVTFASPIEQVAEPGHPVLRYQRESSLYGHPAVYGDAIRPILRGVGPVPRGALKYTSDALRGSYYSGIGSVNADAPFREISTSWERIGILKTVDLTEDSILNLYRRAISPRNDLYEYRVKDKDGFIIDLDQTYLENEDVIDSLPGKESMGAWDVSIDVDNKWIYF